MSSPDDPGFRRRRRRSRRASDGSSDADQPSDQAGTAPRAGRSGRDETANQTVLERGGRTRPASRSSGSTSAAKSAGSSKSAGSGKSAAPRRQPSEPSARTLRETERGWRDLAGNGSSQLGVSGALRARDVSRPGPAELAEAERNVQLVRRQWQPPAAD